VSVDLHSQQIWIKLSANVVTENNIYNGKTCTDWINCLPLALHFQQFQKRTYGVNGAGL